jgi:hypothetical protein
VLDADVTITDGRIEYIFETYEAAINDIKWHKKEITNNSKCFYIFNNINGNTNIVEMDEEETFEIETRFTIKGE